MIGQQIGPYKVLKLLGQGGMGIVYQGMHAKLEQPVAIKVLSPEFSANSEMRERFVREAKLQVKLSHPNVVNILNYLEDNKSVYLVMEFIQGDNLETRLKREGCFEPSECCRIAIGVLDALAFMHKRGIIHRDIKPSNIMFTEDGQVKVTDFGIAKASGEKGLTRTGVQLGTVWYMAPEQIRGGAVDATSDMYALGITLYQMLTGQVPFHSDSEFEIMKAHVEEIPRDPASLNPKIPRELCDVVLKVLAKNPQERFQSAEELRNALLLTAQVPGAGTSALPSGSQGPAFSGYGAVPGPKDAPRWASGEAQLFLGRFDRKISYLIMGMASLLIALLMYVLFFGISQKEEEKKNRIPLTLAPPGAVGPSSPMTVSNSNGSHPLELNPVEKPKPGDVRPGPGDGSLTITKPPPVSIEPPQVQPEPLVPAAPQPEPPKNEELAKPREPPRKPVASARKEGKKTVKSSNIKSPPPADNSVTDTSENKSAGENDKWAIIK
jgi:serine/threonine-protein kinase